MHPTVSALEFPYFSLAERERCWGKIRQFLCGDSLATLGPPSHSDLFDLLQRSILRTSGEEGPTYEEFSER